MDLRYRSTRLLYEEHCATTGFCDDLEDILARGRMGPPSTDDPAVSKTLRAIPGFIKDALWPHFAFEEEHFFPPLLDAGETEICDILKEEHEIMVPIGDRLVELAVVAADHGFSDPDWDLFRALAAELIERLHAHVLKEDMGLIPLVEGVLDGAADMWIMERQNQKS